ncbi:hypothetical protein [Bacteroides fragilis]|uniref:hypothetical protein n=1 Tax=Bacteroides fragilis TaxID=817 RepID=UPI00189D1237|nr:hypothetical protein [Bacteroides fragilis]
MAQLQSIISSVLRDVLVAQHEANIYSMSLSESYRKDGNTELFPLPAIAVGEMELEIRYGIKDVAAQSVQYEINYVLLRKTIRKLTLQLTKVMLESMVHSILSSPLAKDKERIKLVEQLSEQQEIRDKFTLFLDKKLQESVIGHFTNLLKDDGSINAGVLRSCTLQTCNEELLFHSELEELFSGEEGKAVRKKAYSDIEKSIKDITPQLIKDINFKRKRIFPSVDVTVAADELAKLPDECIQSFRFKVSPRSFPLNLIGNGEENE